MGVDIPHTREPHLSLFSLPDSFERQDEMLSRIAALRENSLAERGRKMERKEEAAKEVTGNLRRECACELTRQGSI